MALGALLAPLPLPLPPLPLLPLLPLLPPLLLLLLLLHHQAAAVGEATAWGPAVQPPLPPLLLLKGEGRCAAALLQALRLAAEGA